MLELGRQLKTQQGYLWLSSRYETCTKLWLCRQLVWRFNGLVPFCLLPFCLLPFCLLITARCHFAYSSKMWPKQCKTSWNKLILKKWGLCKTEIRSKGKLKTLGWAFLMSSLRTNNYLSTTCVRACRDLKARQSEQRSRWQGQENWRNRFSQDQISLEEYVRGISAHTAI